MKRLGIVISLATLCACSGGGGSAPAPVTPVPTTAPTAAASQAKATGNATIFIPNASKSKAAARKRNWVSPSTQLVDILSTAADGEQDDVVTAVTPTSPNCTGQTGGRSCTVGFEALPGSNTIQINAFDQNPEFYANLVAAAVSTGVTITGGGANSLSFVLGGVVGQPITLSPASFSVTSGTPQTLTLSIVGSDVDGNPIALYDSPLSISQTDTSGTYTLSTTSIADSSVTPSITIGYNGGSASTTITVATTSANTDLYYGRQSATLTITPQ